MKVGDLVRHKRHGQHYIVASLDESAMVGIIVSAEVRYIHKDWIEVISESR